MNYPHPLIAREGWPFIIAALIVAALAQGLLGVLAAIPVWLIFFFVLQFFRDPPRVVSGDENSIVAPADGRIVAVEETDDPYFSRRAIKISVFMNVFNVHSNRSPIDGTVKQVKYTPGTFINADLDKASTENERCAMCLETSNGQQVACVQIAGLVARRILNYMEPGIALERGQRYGFIRFGSRVDLYLPLDTQVRVLIGEKVYASTTILAEFAKAPHA